MLKIDLKPGQSVRIGDAVVTMEEKSGQRVRLAVQADRSVPIEKVERPPSAEAARPAGT